MEDDSYRFLKPRSLRQQFSPEIQSNPRNKSMYCSSFLLKFFIIAIFLCFLPLFPSEPPEFISETVFAKSWELIHLLVIGIALSYGLFCRRKNPEQNAPNLHNYQQFKPNVVHHSSIFDFEDDNPSRNFNKNGVKNDSNDFSCYRTEPYVVVRKGNGEKVVERSSLGLPVRSLRSRVVESDSEDECVSECETEVSGKSSCSSSRGVTRGGKGEDLEGNVGDYGFSNGWNSRSMREGFEGENGETFEGIMGVSAFPNGWESRSMRAGFMEGNGDFELRCGDGENFGGNVGDNALPNGWSSQPMMAGFEVGNRAFELTSRKGESMKGNVGVGAAPNGWESRFMTGFVAGNGDFGLHSGKGENFEGNVDSNPFPNGCNSRSMRADYMTEDENVKLYTREGEKLDGNTGNSSQVSWKSRSMRSDFKVNNSTFETELSKSQSFRSPIQGPSYGMNAGFCSWLPDSPNVVGGSSGSRVNNTPFSNFHTPVNNSNLMATSNIFTPSATTEPSVTVSTRDFASGSRIYNYDNGNWGTPPILENANMFVDNSSLFIEEVAQPVFCSSLKANEEYFMPRTPEVTPSIPGPSRKLASSVRQSRHSKSKLRLSGNKKDQLLERDIDVGDFAPEGTSSAFRVISPVTVPAPTDDAASPMNGTFSKTNEDLFMPKDSNKKDNLLHNETPKDDVTTPFTNDTFLNKIEQKSFPERWNEDCFVIPLSENKYIEDQFQVDQDEPIPELASLSEVSLPFDPSSSKMSCEEQISQQKQTDNSKVERLMEVVQLKGTENYTEVEDLRKENEPYKPPTPSPPVSPPRVEIRANKMDDVHSSVESSSMALSNGFLLDASNDVDQYSPLTPKRVKSLSKASHSRGFSCTSFFDRDLRRSFRNEAREENRKSEGDQYVGKSGKCGCLSLDVRPTLSKAALKGKSVRTIRPREVEPERNDHTIYLEQKSENLAQRKAQSSEMVVIKIGISEKRPSSNGGQREKQGKLGTSIIVGVNSKEGGSSAKAGVLCDVKEEEPDSEIDKKADEFIAKFKEQIRLQKVSSRQRNSAYQT